MRLNLARWFLMDKNASIIIGAAILAVAIVAAAFMFTHKPADKPDNSAQVACLQGGGNWVGSPTSGSCLH